MLRKIRLFFKLNLNLNFLLLLVWCLSLYTWLLFRFFKSRAKFGKLCVETKSESNQVQTIKNIRFAILINSKYTPWENVCRHQAMQAKILCKLFNIPYLIYVGFKKNEIGEMEGHAWSTVNNEILTGFCVPEEYTIQAVYGN
jgi:hypothetical protein